MREDVELAAKKLGKYGIGLKSTIAHVSEIIGSGEVVKCCISGNLSDKTFGLIMLTNARIIFSRKLFASTTERSYPMQTVTSVGSDGVPVFSKMTITYAGGSDIFTNVPSKLCREFVNEAHDVLLTSKEAKPVERTPSQSPAERLLQLKQLLDAGVLTNDEYDAKAAEIKALL